MAQKITLDNLYQTLKARLQLKLCAGEAGLHRPLLDESLDASRDTIVGPMTYIHPNRIQLIGQAEQAYLDAPERDRALALEKLFQDFTWAVVLVDGVQPMQDMCEKAEQTKRTLFSTPLADRFVLENLQHFAALHLSEKITLHGVFLEVLGMGVLITGDPAVGKSELALELISRGSRLIADDVPEFSCIAPDVISGQCPEILSDFLEVRGLGVLNIRAMFGDNAIKKQKYLRLIVHLKAMSEQQISTMPRLPSDQEVRDILSVPIPSVTIPVAPGRNLAILVEAAVRNHLLKRNGYDATQAFIERQQNLLK